ncbi:MAG: AAA family ATPase [Flammeovirgaceae bacterium]
MDIADNKIVSPRYKFKDLKVYASTEWLAEGKKKYRRVFEKDEVAYLYVELSGYNKLFDNADWDAKIQLICHRFVKNGKEKICTLDVDRKIAEEEPVFYVREGWGHANTGQYWKRGSYLWEAYIAEEITVPQDTPHNDDGTEHEGETTLDYRLAGSVTFYIEDAGLVTEDENPYFDINHVRLYEGAGSGVNMADRTYFTQFNRAETRYVWAEFFFENMLDRSWYGEFFFNFYNSEGQLKGTTSELRQIRQEEDEITIVTGWGSDTKGTWFNDRYTLEIVFMGKLIAVIPFKCAEKEVEGYSKVFLGDEVILEPQIEDQEEATNETLEELLAELDTLVGLREIKQQVRDYLEYLEFLKIRKEKGFNEDDNMSLHSVFKGNPGTGKTTLARLLGKIYHKMGFLSNGKLHEVGRSELVGQYIGQTAPKVKDVIERARGGVLFIDEAYALVRNEDDDKDYGKEVVEVLVKEMSDGKGDLAIFVAGYPAEMDVFINSNPGFKSRFNVTFEFPDYLPQELIKIGDLVTSKKEMQLSKGARAYLRKQLTEKYRNRDNSFGNARLVGNIMDKAKLYMGLRVMKNLKTDKIEEVPRELLQNIRQRDLERVFAEKKKRLPQIGLDEALLNQALEELNALIGLASVKKEINELVSLVRFYTESGRDVLGKMSLHTAFKGNPGTGKTTVARILSKIFKALGILERGHLVEGDRQSLVAGFIGQTALKTKEMIERAKGGVLFIDEAYALFSEGTKNDFGKEAVEIILKEMEDSRGEFIVIVAGYTEPMDNFLKMNPGLKSRFDKELIFEDFTKEELVEVVKYMFAEENLELNAKAAEHMEKYCYYLYNRRDKFFGNARTIRKIVRRVTKNQHLRMAGLPKEKRTEKVLRTVILNDVKEFSSDNKELGGKPSIGFNIY